MSLESHLKRRKKNKEEPSGSFPYVPHTFIHLTASGKGWQLCFSNEEIIEAKRDGGCVVIPLL